MEMTCALPPQACLHGCKMLATNACHQSDTLLLLCLYALVLTLLINDLFAVLILSCNYMGEVTLKRLSGAATHCLT